MSETIKNEANGAYGGHAISLPIPHDLSNADAQVPDLIAAAMKALEVTRKTSIAASAASIRINAILW